MPLRIPALREGILLHLCYAVPVTFAAYLCTRSLCGARYLHSVSLYALAMQCPVLRVDMRLPGSRGGAAGAEGRVA
eukprot:3941800-Rhodomonas_salina.1